MSHLLEPTRPLFPGRWPLVLLAIGLALAVLLTTQATTIHIDNANPLQAEVMHQWRICQSRQGLFTLGWNVDHSVSTSQCLGGMLDGRTCIISPEGPGCTLRIGPESGFLPWGSEPVLLP